MSRLRDNPWAVLVLLSLGFFMILLDTTIVNIAIPSIIDELHASLDSILWVLNAYILVYAVLLITAGRLGDIYGQRNLFVLGLAVFVLASAACGAAQNTSQLIAARVVQGFGGALLTPQTLSIITSIFPPQRRGAAFGVWGAVAGIAAMTGPTLGGFLVTYVNWRWIFFVNVPIGIFTIVAGLLVIPDLRPGRRHGLDPIGVLLATAGLFGICFGLIEGQRYDWGTVAGFLTIPEVIVAGLAIIAVFFAVWEPRQQEPLVPLSLFRDRNFSLMNWVSAAVAFGMFGMIVPLVIYLQSVLGFSAVKAGLTMLPMSLVSMPVAPFAGRLADRIGGKYILMFGLTMFAAGFGLVDWVASTNSQWYDFTLPVMVAGLGMGCTFAPMTTVAMRHIEPRMAGAASGIFNTARQLGGVLGSAVVGAVLQNRLSMALHDQAVTRSAGLPPQFRQQFIDGFSHAAKSGFEVGRGQVGGSLPAGLPPAVAHQLQQLAHEVFADGYIDAMRATLVVPLVVLLVGALSCLAIRRRSREDRAATVKAAAAP
ncbi:MAG TPA: DHA2 family efflux MFS transporter permease subunit [Candidatus Dormibacteraeota bacterium]